MFFRYVAPLYATAWMNAPDGRYLGSTKARSVAATVGLNGAFLNIRAEWGLAKTSSGPSPIRFSIDRL